MAAWAQAQAFWFFSWWYALGTRLIFIHQFVFIHFVIGNIFMGFNKKKIVVYSLHPWILYRLRRVWKDLCIQGPRSNRSEYYDVGSWRIQNLAIK